jgi:cell division protein FtsZ
MQEVSEAAKIITSSADENAKVIFGTVIDESLGEELRITVIATGFDEPVRRTRMLDEEAKTVTQSKPQLTAPTFVKKKVPDVYREPVREPQREPVRETIREIVREIDIEDEFEEETRPSFNTRSMTKEPPRSSPPVHLNQPSQNTPSLPTTNKDDEDLEIPAFIRRKMGI